MKRKCMIFISLFFLVLGIIVSYFSFIPGFISAIFGTVGSIISIFIPNNFIYDFTKDDDWVEFGKYYKLTIPSSKHKFGKNPNIKLLKREENGCYTDFYYIKEIGINGDILIISPKIDGRAIIN